MGCRQQTGGEQQRVTGQEESHEQAGFGYRHAEDPDQSGGRDHAGSVQWVEACGRAGGHSRPSDGKAVSAFMSLPSGGRVTLATT